MPDSQTTLGVFEEDKQDFDRLKARYYLRKKLEAMPSDPTFFKILVRSYKEE